MPRHIIIAESARAKRRYIASSRRGRMTAELIDAALFVGEEAAAAAVRDLLKEDFERKNKVTLVLGTVEFTVATTRPVARKAVATGYVVHRNNGRYYKGPRTRLPRDFMDAHYHYVENRDAATVFPSEEVALKTGEACRAIRLKAAEDDRQNRFAGTYQKLYDEFAFTVEAV